MGKSYTPKYRVEYRDQAGHYHMAWHHKRDGVANADNLEKWRKTYNRSFQHDGTNAHIAQARGTIPHISRAELILQKTGAIVAQVTMPMFEVV